MKLFNWRQKNLRQTQGQALIHLILGGSSITECTDARKQHPRVYGDDVDSHVTNGSLKHAIQATWPQTDEQCWEAEKAADLHCRIQSELLAIGTLGLIGLEDDAEREAGVGGDGRNVEKNANMVHFQEKVLVLQNELEKAFSIPNATEESNMSQQRYHIICEGGVGFENDKLTDPSNGRVGKVTKVFLVKNSHETPYFGAMKKQITHASFMLDSSLSGSKSIAFEDIKKQGNRAADSLKRLFSVTRTHLFRTLFKSKRTPEQSPLDLSHPSKLKKLLDPFFQKRRAVSSRPPRQLTEPISLADNDKDSCCNDVDIPLLRFPNLVAGSTGCISITDDVSEEFQSSSDGDSDFLRPLLVYGSTRDNEYWINTDDEYVVLEL